MERRLIEVQGIVQGVGFRPFTKTLADRIGVTGYCMNMGTYVRIEAQGQKDKLDQLTQALKDEAPPLSYVASVAWRPMLTFESESGFAIRESAAAPDTGVLQMPPDAGICADCARELFDVQNRRYLHPLIACTNCGPRFTIIEGAPYDRQRTVMRAFPLCERCREEYENPSDRRFHAQPVCCLKCGPALFLLGKNGQRIASDDPIKYTRSILAKGGIAAVKGLGGYHLVCDALDDRAVQMLRERKGREAKPLAVMAPGLDTARKFCEISAEEEKLLTSPRRPIMLLKKKKGTNISNEIAYENPYLGLMLPSTGIQMLLHRYPDGGKEFPLLVMTSGNLSEEPICITEECAVEKLGSIADAILAHDRRIITRTDDSVARILSGKICVIRRARGITPLPVALPFDTGKAPDIFAAGAQTKNTWCLVRKAVAFIGPHIGDLDDLDALESYTNGVERFCRQTGVFPTAAAHDMHPDYLSTMFVQRFASRIAVQHHHAHMAAVMAENGLTGSSIGVIFDGMGLGSDGTLWGGEFLSGGYTGFERMGHINAITMYGGDRAAKEPWLSAAFWLRSIPGKAAEALAERIEGEEREKVEQLQLSGIGKYETSSFGRLFEAVSAMLGIRRENRYEGEAAMALEWAAGEAEGQPYDIILENNKDGFILDMRSAVSKIAEDIISGKPKAEISARFHETAAEAVLLGCLETRKRTRLSKAVLGGGVFQNARLLQAAGKKLASNGFDVFTASAVPSNDGGISLGQAAVAAARLSGS
ncbi:MAG: carbamoyltransferase HypF [Bacillota bacterium]|nr:carbamoyltransferase HypF [Bacillota bacterium]